MQKRQGVYVQKRHHYEKNCFQKMCKKAPLLLTQKCAKKRQKCKKKKFAKKAYRVHLETVRTVYINSSLILNKVELVNLETFYLL